MRMNTVLVQDPNNPGSHITINEQDYKAHPNRYKLFSKEKTKAAPKPEPSPEPEPKPAAKPKSRAKKKS